MGLLEIIRQSANGDDGTLYECRGCGAIVDADVTECPECGSTEIASYTL